MPLPGYIVCSQSGSEDQFSHSVSAFGVFESIDGKEAPLNSDGIFEVIPLSMRIVATWFKSTEDTPETAFQTDVAIFLPGRTKEFVRIEFPDFYFAQSVRRFVVPQFGFPADVEIGSGFLRIESRIRKAGETEWMDRQEFRILLNEHAPPSPKTNGSAT
jgi:hypothetical protein